MLSGFTDLSVLGHKESRPLGMIGDVLIVFSGRLFRRKSRQSFGGLEGAYGARTGEVSRACVVGAMRPALVYEATERGAQVYLTGQYRKGAAKAVAETGMSVFEVGHERSEVWGTKSVSGDLAGAVFRALEVVLSLP